MRTKRTAQLVAALAAGVVLFVYLGHVSRFVEYVNDDAYISFRYSRNLATGIGPYFNPGEHVEGYTNLSLVLAMAVVHWVGGDIAVPTAAKGLGLLAAVVTLGLLLALARRLSPLVGFSRWDGLIWGPLAAGLTAASPGFVVNSVSGLETTLLGACLVAAVWCDVRGKWLSTALWLSVALLTRPEVVVVVGVYLLVRFAQVLLKSSTPDSAAEPGASMQGVRPLIQVVLVLAAALAAQLVFRLLAYDGELLPNTYYAKAGGFWGEDAWGYVYGGALTPLLGLGGGVLALLGWLAPGGLRAKMLPLGAAAVTGASLPFVIGTDWMIGWRFTAPYLPLIALAVVFGWVRLVGLGGQRRAWLTTALLVVLPLSWFAQSDTRFDFDDYVTTKARGYRNGHSAVAHWILDQEPSPGDSIALMDIGIVSYLCGEQRILDITGLTDRFIAKSPGRFLAKEYDPAYVLDQEPRFIVLAYVVGGDPRQPPPLGAPILGWNEMETRLFRHPEFKRWYIEPHDSATGTDWRDWYARRLGAAAVFWHDEPQIHYLLAVHRRQEVPAGDLPAL